MWNRQYCLGLVFMMGTVLIMTWDSVVVEALQDRGLDPVFITFVVNAMYPVNLLFVKKKNKGERAPSAKPLAVIYFFAAATFSLSIEMTSITSYMILNATGSLWAFFFAVLWGVERKAGSHRIVGAVLTIAGSALAALADRDSSKSESLLGDFFGILSAALYGLYGTGLRAFGDDGAKTPALFFGMMGVWTLVFFTTPMIVYLLVLSHLHGSWMSLAKLTGVGGHGKVLLALVLKALINNVPQSHCWAAAIVRTGPTVATIGCSLTIPLAFLTDAFITQDLPTTTQALSLQISGAVLVVVGFLLTTFASTDAAALDTTKEPPSLKDDVDLEKNLGEPLLLDDGSSESS